MAGQRNIIPWSLSTRAGAEHPSTRWKSCALHPLIDHRHAYKRNGYEMRFTLTCMFSAEKGGPWKHSSWRWELYDSEGYKVKPLEGFSPSTVVLGVSLEIRASDLGVANTVKRAFMFGRRLHITLWDVFQRATSAVTFFSVLKVLQVMRSGHS
eukprot:2621559-Amphidinium_carterae.1